MLRYFILLTVGFLVVSFFVRVTHSLSAEESTGSTTVPVEEEQTATEKKASTEVEPEVQVKAQTKAQTLIEAASPIEKPLIVRKLSVSGNYPYLSKKILRLSSLQSGEPFRAEAIAEDEKRIAEFFEKEGYYETTVAITHTPDLKEPFINVKIKIHKGKTYRLGDAKFTGNHFFSNSYLKNKLFSFSHFRLNRIKKKLKKIEKIYSEKGFVRARTKLISTEINHDKKQIDVIVEITERRRLILYFDGNNMFKPQRLDDYVTFYKERGYDRFEIERSEAKLLEFYRNNGYMDAAISTVVADGPNDEVIITFNINEGRRARLKKVIFDGAEGFSKKALSKVMANRTHTLTRQGYFREDIIEEDLERIAKLYHDHGFFDANILGWEATPNKFRDQITMTIRLEEGKAYTLDSVLFEGNKSYETDLLIKKGGFKLGKQYDADKIAKAQKKVETFYQSEGYPYAKFATEMEPDPKNNTTKLKIAVDEGTQAYIGNIVVNGQYNTRDKVFDDCIKFKSGDIYTYKKILDAQLNLKRLGIFDHVRISTPGVEEEKPVVDVFVEVTERKSLTFDVDAGYDSDKLLSGQLIITKRNIFGLAKQLQFRLIGGFEFDRGEMTLFSPRVLGASWNLVNQYFAEYEDDENFNASTFGGSIGALKNFGPNFSYLTKAQVSRLNIFESESNTAVISEDNLFDSTFLEIINSVVYDTRDNFADPSRGIYTFTTTEFDTDLADASNFFNISTINAAHYAQLHRFTLVNTLRVGKIFRIANGTRIPATKLFFMGGNDTVRGFDEDAINPGGGTTSIIYNAELHFRLFSNFKLAGFFDAGSLTDQFSDISSNTIRDSAGFGIRYFTPVGPIRLDYGFVLDKKPGEDGQRLHFSFGYFF